MLGHGVDLAVHSIRCIRLEFNCVIPWAFWRKSLRCFFTEQILELMVLIWDLRLDLLFIGLNIQFGGDSSDSTVFDKFIYDNCLHFFCLDGGDDWELGNSSGVD